MSREMKQSGVPWLKDIPMDWNIERGKNVLVLQKRPVRDDDDVVTCFRDGEVILRSLRRTEGFTMSDKEIGYQGINQGDIVIHGMDGFAGAMGVSKSTGKGSPVLIVCTPKFDAIPQYLIYYLRALAMTDVFIALATGIRERSCDLRWNKISELEFILPSSTEQQEIAEFLDKKCGEVDEMIVLQEHIIEELKAYRQSVITEAVTKGLNPNVPMKDSGIEWIREIPEHWEVKPIKYNFDRRSEKNNPIKTTERLSLSIDKGVTLYAEKTTNLDRFKDDFTQYQLAYPNDIVLNCMNMIVGAVGLSKYKGCVSPVYYVIHPSKANINAEFYSYLLNIPTIRGLYHSYGKGIYAIERGEGRVNTCRLKVSYDDFGRFEIPIPPIYEQENIVSHIKMKCDEIDELISIKQQKIESLKEYKKSIIYEYVTGKREV